MWPLFDSRSPLSWVKGLLSELDHEIPTSRFNELSILSLPILDLPIRDWYVLGHVRNKSALAERLDTD